ncbi:MAG: hypothetical protein ACYCTB_04440 [bacterium]
MKKSYLIVFFLIISIFSASFMLSGCSNIGGSVNGTYYSTILGKKSYVELFKKGRCYIHTNYIDSMGKWLMHKNRITMQASSAVLHFKYINGALYLSTKGKYKHFVVIDKIPFGLTTKFVKKSGYQLLSNQNNSNIVGNYKGYISLSQKKMASGFFGGSYLQWVASKTPVDLKIKGKNKVILSAKKLFSPVTYRYIVSGDVVSITGSAEVFNYSGNTLKGKYLILKHKNKIALVSAQDKSIYFIKQ